MHVAVESIAFLWMLLAIFGSLLGLWSNKYGGWRSTVASLLCVVVAGVIAYTQPDYSKHVPMWALTHLHALDTQLSADKTALPPQVAAVHCWPVPLPGNPNAKPDAVAPSDGYSCMVKMNNGSPDFQVNTTADGSADSWTLSSASIAGLNFSATNVDGRMSVKAYAKYQNFISSGEAAGAVRAVADGLAKNSQLVQAVKNEQQASQQRAVDVKWAETEKQNALSWTK